MTACVNNKKYGRRVAGVVTASLVGALTLGGVSLAAVPTVALAEDATVQADWNENTSVVKAENGRGFEVADPKNATFEVGTGEYLRPTVISNGSVDVNVTGDGYALGYYEASDLSTMIAASDSVDNAKLPSTVFGKGGRYAKEGTYAVKVFKKVDGKVDSANPSQTIYFKLADTTLDGVKASKDSYTFNGAVQDVEFVNASGKTLKTTGSEADASVSWSASPKDAGTYYATLTDSDDRSKTAVVKVTVDKLDLAKASIVAKDVKVGSNVNGRDIFVSVNGGPEVRYGDDLGLKTESVIFKGTNTSGVTVAADAGQYEVTGAIKSSAAANFTDAGAKGSFTFYAYDQDVFSNANGYKVFYNGKDAGSTLTLDGSEKFDASKLSVSKSDGTVLDASKYEVSYYKEKSNGSKGDEVKAEDLANAGRYVVTVTVKPYEDVQAQSWFGGSADLHVQTYGGLELDSSKNLSFLYDGVLATNNSQSVEYDGSNQAARVTASVKDGSGRQLKEGTDYTLEVTDKDGKAVDSATDAGEYTVTVKPLTFFWGDNGANAKFTLQVSRLKLDDAAKHGLFDYVYQANTTDLAAGKYAGNYSDDALNYTGSAVEVPGVQYKASAKSGKYVALDPSLYKVSSVKDSKGRVVESMVDAGTYTVHVELTEAGQKNYSLDNGDFTVQVKKYSPFADTTSPAWYAKVVEQAASKGYVNGGVGGAGLFAPTSSLTRAQAIAILYNMAGGKLGNGSNEFGWDTEHGYNTGFSDTEDNAWYGQALAWGHNLGIANGYGDGTFHPNATITREEFASLLANYAKVKGEDVTSDGSALAKLSDGSQVSDWAKANVAWAVDKGVMGNGGSVNAHANILRAETAAMAVNYQPEKLG